MSTFQAVERKKERFDFSSFIKLSTNWQRFCVFWADQKLITMPDGCEKLVLNENVYF